MAQLEEDDDIDNLLALLFPQQLVNAWSGCVHRSMGQTVRHIASHFLGPDLIL